MFYDAQVRQISSNISKLGTEPSGQLKSLLNPSSFGLPSSKLMSPSYSATSLTTARIYYK